MKLSRRQRYIVKWNGPRPLDKREWNAVKSRRGYGDKITREFATAYWCRYHGFFPETVEELGRLSGVGGRLAGKKRRNGR